MSKDKISWSQDWCCKHCPRLHNAPMDLKDGGDYINIAGVEFGLNGHPACVKIDFASAKLSKTQKALIEYDCRHSGIIDALENWADWERDCQACPLYKEKLPQIGDTECLF